MATMFHNALFQNSKSGGGHLTTAPDSPVRHAELYTLNIPQDACVGSVFAVVFFAIKNVFVLFSFLLILHHICSWFPAPNTFQILLCKYTISVTSLIILHVAVLLCHSSTDLLHSFRAWISVLCVWAGELTGNQLSACVFACALLSITTTSFCNYTLHCTQTRHQVGPEPTSTAPPALITVAFWKNPSRARVPGQQEALCTSEVPQARGPISRLGLQTLNFILYHQKVSSPHWFTIWAFMARLVVWLFKYAASALCSL